MNITTEARNATLTDLVGILQRQLDCRYDVVAPAEKLAFQDGVLQLKDHGEVVMDAEGVSVADVALRPTAIFDEQMAGRLDIPVGYFRRMRTEAVELLDHNVNHWLGTKRRSFLVRGFRAEGAPEGMARSILTDRRGGMDNIDAVTSVLEGIGEAGVEVDPEGIRGDLTERNVRLSIPAPGINMLAPALLAGYRSPYSGNTGAENPTVFAGLDIRNSETGNGAVHIGGRLTVQICGNGMNFTKEAFRRVHLGSQLDVGSVDWSHETHQANLELIKQQAKDAVRKFLSPEWLAAKVAELEALSGTEVSDPVKAIEVVGQKLAYSDTERAGILSMFIKGGQPTAGGVMQAITAYSQTVAVPDRVQHLEDTAVNALQLVGA
jgi:hypothetical protein